MKTLVPLLAVIVLLQGPVCPMSVWAAPSKPAPAAHAHDCCPGDDASGSIPVPADAGQHDDGAATVACAAHCATLVQALAVVPPVMDAAGLHEAPGVVHRAPVPFVTARISAADPPDRSSHLQSVPLLI